MDTVHESSPRSLASLFEKISLIALFVTIILGFLAFAPSTFLLLAVVKIFVIVTGIIVSAIFFILSKIKSKSISFFSHPFIWAGSATILATLISALLSPSIASSFLGKDFSATTAAFTLVLFVSGVLTYALTKGRENVTFYLFLSILGSFSFLALFHIVRFLAGANFLSLGNFTSIVTTTVGTWHDLGIIAGLVLIISLVTLELLPIRNKRASIFFISSFVLAVIILVVVNLESVWIVVTLTTLVFSAYEYILKYRETKGELNKKIVSSIPIFPGLVILGAIVFLWSPGIIGTFISNDIVAKAGASYTEINLPLSETIDIIGPTIKSSPVFGAGPDRFINQYLLHKPEIINATPFWSTTFSNGTGFFLTSLVTEGILGFALWLIVCIVFVWSGAKVLLGKNNASLSSFTRYGIAASYFGGLLILIALISYTPQHTVLLVLFVLLGIFAAHLQSVKKMTIHFSSGPLKIPVIIILWILVAAAAVLFVFYAKAVIAEAYFESAFQQFAPGGSIIVGAQKIDEALKFNANDVYYQAISQVDIYAINQVVSQATTTPSQQTVQFVLGLVNDGVNASLFAQKFDPTNPYNYLAEAQVSTVAAGIGVPGAYATATSSFQKVANLDPLDPTVYLEAAKLEFFEKNDSGAKNDINIALELKPNYTDALFEAGIISYTDKDYVTALKAFSTVQQLDPSYSNIQTAVSLAKSAQAGGLVEPSPTVMVNASSTTTKTVSSGTTKTKSK